MTPLLNATRYRSEVIEYWCLGSDFRHQTPTTKVVLSSRHDTRPVAITIIPYYHYYWETWQDNNASEEGEKSEWGVWEVDGSNSH